MITGIVGTIREEFEMSKSIIAEDAERLMQKPTLTPSDISTYKTLVLGAVTSFDIYFGKGGHEEFPNLRTSLQKGAAVLLNKVMDKYEQQTGVPTR
nr:hypothetical protein [uncultured archaeon]AQS33489.1 hypothetical protein [uncultured archaeon]